MTSGMITRRVSAWIELTRGRVSAYGVFSSDENEIVNEDEGEVEEEDDGFFDD